MPSPRRVQIDIEATPYYHCISRCVRRAFLCGDDAASGRNFDHRKGWVVETLAALADLFAVGVCAYGVLSNHFHLVLYVDSESARAWDDDEVVARYTRLFRSKQDPRGRSSPGHAAEEIQTWRIRLADLSWFMRCLNESIARRANQEDDCTGRFWEGRFRSQALLDQAGLLTCMSYVDLNPIRAGLADSLEESDFTSIQQRLIELAGEPTAEKGARPAPDSARASRPRLALIEFTPRGGAAHDAALPLDRDDYVELVRATAAALRAANPAPSMPEPAVQTLVRHGICPERWLQTLRP